LEIFRASPISDLRPVRAEGCWIWDEKGRRYLDLLAGTWCTVLGHGHPRFTQAIRTQAEKLIHTGTGVVPDEVRKAADHLGGILPAHLNHVTFLNTGSEAVEFALKVARIATNRSEIVSFRQGYYGATVNALGLSEIGRGASYLPEASKIPPIPAPTCYRCPLGKSYPECEYACLIEWRRDTERYARQVAAIIFEPVQGRAVIVPPDGYLKKLAELAKEWECMLISEEVTTGMGRTGYWFGFQREDLAPDVLVLAKALGNGLPVAAVVTTTEAEKEFAGKFTHVQSHQNDPFTGAIVSVVIDTIREERLVEKARDMGSYLLRGLDQIESAHTGVRNARGLGLMAAVELEGLGAEERGVRIQHDLMDRGVIVDFSRAVSSFRFFPPYVIAKEQLDMALQALDSALQNPH